MRTRKSASFKLILFQFSPFPFRLLFNRINSDANEQTQFCDSSNDSNRQTGRQEWEGVGTSKEQDTDREWAHVSWVVRQAGKHTVQCNLTVMSTHTLSAVPPVSSTSTLSLLGNFHKFSTHTHTGWLQDLHPFTSSSSSPTPPPSPPLSNLI